jgi:hypothetical protein
LLETEGRSASFIHDSRLPIDGLPAQALAKAVIFS